MVAIFILTMVIRELFLVILNLWRLLSIFPLELCEYVLCLYLSRLENYRLIFYVAMS